MKLAIRRLVVAAVLVAGLAAGTAVAAGSPACAPRDYADWGLHHLGTPPGCAA